MSAMPIRRPRPYDEQAVQESLLDHAFRVALHRLRGVQSLLVGWAEIGVQGDEAQRVRAHHEEATRQLARLEWLHGARARALPLERLAGGEAPQVLLAAAVCHATPEEAGDKLPRVLDPEAALALALWAEAQRAEGEPAEVRFRWDGMQLELRLENAAATDLTDWQARWGRFLAAQAPGTVSFRAGCFRPLPEGVDAASGHDL